MAQSDAEIMKLVLEAEDRLTPDLTKLQQRIQSLTGSLVELSESSKIDFRELTGSDRELALLHNSIITNTTALEGLTRGTDEYNITLHALMNSVDSYIEKKQQLEDIATQEVVETLKRQQAVADYNYEQKMATQAIKEQESELQNYVKQTSTVAQSVEYWKQKVDEIKIAISDQAAKLKDAEQTYGKTSKQANEQRAELQRLEKEYKQLNRTLKDAKQNQGFFADSLDLVRDKIKQNLALTIGKSLVSFAVQGVKEMARNIIEYGTQMNAVSLQFEQMSYRAGMSYTDLRDTLRESSKGMVDDINLMQSANRAMSLGVAQDIESMSNLMKIAQVRGAQMGETTSKAFDDIVTGIGRQSAMILDNLGIVINSKDAYERYATSIGKSTDELTKQEKQQAITNEVIRQSGEELKARENMPLTVAQKIDKLKVSAVNSFAAIGDAFFKRTEPMLDEIIKISDTLTEKLTQSTDEFNQSTGNVWATVSATTEQIWQNIEITANNIWGVVKGVFEKVTEIFGKITTFIADILFGIDKDSSTCAYSFRDHFLLAITMIGQAFSSLSLLVSQFWRALNQGTENISNWATAIGGGLKGVWNAMKEGKTDLVTEFQRGFGTAEVVETEIITRKDAMAERETLGGQFITQVENLGKDLVEADRYTGSKLGDWWKSIFGGDEDNITGGGGSSKKGKSQAEKDMENRVKQMKKDLEDLKKQDAENLKALDQLARQELGIIEDNISDINKKYQEQFNELQKLIDNTQKKIDSLTKEIAELQQKLLDLKVDENKSIAQEVVKARSEIKKLEEEYKGLKEVAESVSMSDLEGKSGVGKFDVDLIKKYKEYQDELSGMYDGMSASEQEALNKEIEYAERYDSLNGIEKIKEDYRIRREEIQNELNEKVSALNSEQALLRQYKAEQSKLQEQRIKEIEAEEKKYKDLYDNLVEFENKYYMKRDDNHTKMMKSLSDLEQKWYDVARAKEKAMNGGSGNYRARAIGGPVRENQPYLVGEMGPELFVPNSAGRIINNNELNKGDSPINIVIEMGGVVLNSEVDKDELLNDMEDRLTRKLQLYKKGIYA